MFDLRHAWRRRVPLLRERRECHQQRRRVGTSGWLVDDSLSRVPATRSCLNSGSSVPTWWISATSAVGTNTASAVAKRSRSTTWARSWGSRKRCSEQRVHACLCLSCPDWCDGGSQPLPPSGRPSSLGVERRPWYQRSRADCGYRPVPRKADPPVSARSAASSVGHEPGPACSSTSALRIEGSSRACVATCVLFRTRWLGDDRAAACGQISGLDHEVRAQAGRGLTHIKRRQ